VGEKKTGLVFQDGLEDLFLVQFLVPEEPGMALHILFHLIIV
jgi:hypothetical protein